MASDVLSPYNIVPSSTISFLLLLLLLLPLMLTHSSMVLARKDHTFSPHQAAGNPRSSASSELQVATRRHGMNNAEGTHDSILHNPTPNPRWRRSRRGFVGRRSSLPWQEAGVFNASAHEVPSGPNPISNR